jgi:hypothetical protein
MADDTMEISSEHGQNIGDEDIDFDIDFTAGHVDEDYVLEDAASNAGFGDEFHPQPSLVMGHDDLMIDDGDETYPMHMDGDDFMGVDDTHNMEDEPLSMSSAPTSIPTVLAEEASHIGNSSHLENGSMTDEVSWEVNDELEPAGNDGNVEAPEQSHESNHEEGELQEHTDLKEVDAHTASAPHEDSQLDTPNDGSPKVHAVGEEPRSPPASTSAAEDESQGHGSNHPTEPLNGSSRSHSVASTNETAAVEETASFSLTHEVVVVYQDSEYSLFSKSGTDDIDSYFLYDMSIMDKPLSNFFEAIRDVIRDDLNVEDELCISVEDLGLDIEEVSCPTAYWQQAGLTSTGQRSSMIETVTIGQIISLHEKLLHNDGVGSVRPLCLQLRTRPNFSIRFANLTSKASEGKCLSELVQWDEQSESFDDPAHVTDNERGEEVEGESYEGDNGLKESIEKGENEVPQQQSSDDSLAQEFTTEQEPHQEADNIESLLVSGIAATNGTYEHNDPVAQHTAAEELLPSQKTETSGSGEDEDGDLIDYSEVEDETQSELRKDAKSRPTKLEIDDSRTHNGTFTDFIPPCLKPQTCFCSKCNDLLLAEYEAINEERRRRSISRAAEGNLLELAAEPSVANEHKDHDHETNFETENGIEDDENDVEDFDQGNQTPEQEDPSADFGEDNAEFNHHEDEFYIEDGDIDGDMAGGEVVDGHDLTTEPTHEGDQETFDEFDLGEDDDTQPQHKLLEFVEQEPISDDDISTPVADPTAKLSRETFSIGSSLESANAPDSESAASEKTLEAQPVPTDDLTAEFNEENEEEINYDDEEPDIPQNKEPNVKELQAANGSGKRQRADEDSASAESKGMCRNMLFKARLTNDSSEAKRPRS